MGAIYFSGELFKSLSKVDFAYVQYKGGGPAVVDLIGGHVDAMFATCFCHTGCAVPRSR